jgi:hypothetical protein
MGVKFSCYNDINFSLNRNNGFLMINVLKFEYNLITLFMSSKKRYARLQHYDNGY